MANVQAQVFARASGRQLAEIESEIGEVSWVLNGIGRVSLTMPYTEPKCTPTNLESGNRLRLSFDVGLPDWGGVFDFPQTQTTAGVEVTGYTGAKLLDWRVSPKGRYFDQASAGYIFQKRIEEANDVWQTGLQFLTAYPGGAPRTLEDHYHDLYRRLQDLVRLTGGDFAISPVLADGHLSFWASWLERQGSNKAGQVLLVEGQNVIEPRLSRVGPIANAIYTIGEGSTWGEERLVGFAKDDASIARYGYRQYAEVQGGVKEQTTLDANAEELLASLAEPRKRFTVPVMDEAPAGFARYDVGDVVTLQCFLASSAWSFDGPVRIRARSWRGGDLCRLEVEEYV